MRVRCWATGFVWIALACPVAAAVTVTSEKGPDGRRVVVMENAAMRLTVDPGRGGRVSSFIPKATGRDWVTPGNTGFVMDHVWQQTWPGELLSRPYDVKIVSAGPDKGTVRASVTIQGAGDNTIAGVRLTRTMTLTGDRPRIDVTIRLDNPTGEARAPGLWVQNVIRVGGSRHDPWTWRPTTRGVLGASFDTQTNKPVRVGHKSDFAFDPVAGWSAETCPPAAEGVVFYMDYNHLRTLYNNAGSQSIEWWYDQVRLAPGKSFETKVVAWMVTGMTRVSHASLSLVSDLQMAGAGPSLVLRNRVVAGPDPVPGPVKVTLTLLDYDTARVVKTKTFAGVTVGTTPTEQALAVPNAPRDKNLLARATVTDARGKQQTYETYRPGPAVMGTEKPYKTSRPSRVRPIDRPAHITKTPHEGFRVLHLRGLFQNHYRLPEVARALRAELKHGSYRVFVYGPSLSYFPSGYRELMGYDAIVINNVPIEAIDDQTQQYLADYVEHGGVLVVIGGHWAFGGGAYKGSRLEQVLPVTTKAPFDVVPIANGLLDPQPPGGGHVGTAWIQDVLPRPTARVTVRAGGKPFWIEWKRGQGVAAVMTGVCYGEAPKGMGLFWLWSGWPKWLADRLATMSARTGK